MTSSSIKQGTSFRRFITFYVHFFTWCFALRGVLGSHLALVVLGGILFSRFEGTSAWQGIYFAIITATTVGFGDITPETLPGQCVSIALALTGTIFFGLIVAVATRAFTTTIHDFGDTD